MDVRPEPVEQPRETAIRESVDQARHFLAGSLEDLRAVEVAQRIGREVPHRSHGPMNILQTASTIVGNLKTKNITIRGVPGGRKIGWREVASEHRPLQFEADHDVHVVGRLIGFDPDETRGHAIRTLVGRPGIDAGDRSTEVTLEKRGCELPERLAPTDLVFPHSTLAFVDAQ